MITFLRSKYHSLIQKRKCKSGKGIKFFLKSEIINLDNNRSKIEIGDRCLIAGQLLVDFNSKGIIIGDKTYIGENSKIWSAEKITIGSNVLISFGVNIMDNDSHPISGKSRREHFNKVYKTNTISSLFDVKKSSIVISDDVWIGFNSIILKGVKIGKGAIVASGAVVTKDVEEYTVVAGNPATVISSAKK